MVKVMHVDYGSVEVATIELDDFTVKILYSGKFSLRNYRAMASDHQEEFWAAAQRARA